MTSEKYMEFEFQSPQRKFYWHTATLIYMPSTAALTIR